MATFSDNAINQIVFNKVTQEQYEQMVTDGTINDNEFYITESEQIGGDYYTKEEVDGKITTINESIATKTDHELFEAVVNDLEITFDTKADKSNTYTKDEIDEMLNSSLGTVETILSEI